MLEVIPGILEKDWNEIERKIELVKSFAKVIHIDIIDGKFAPNTTFLDPAPFTKYTKDIFFELHMMVEDPIKYLKPFAVAGFKRFLGQIEKMPDQAEFVAQGELLGKVGLALDGPTDLSAIKIPYGDLDCVLVMTIKAGESGKTFKPEYLKKVEMLKQVQHDIKIEIDGGVNDQTIVIAKNAGATRFVANSFLFNSEDPQEQYNLLKTIVEK
ncbi:MAG: hypothetical protein Q7R31_04600 [Candidatus Levybacteria bacterium]|nr:hypothetical protein [Candidatus Levybacteria bacterium]